MSHIQQPGSDLTQAFERALGEITARVPAFADRRALAVAYSGGLDSSVLLQLTSIYAAQRGIKLFAFHIHHGLSPNADDWLAHCSATCAGLDIAFAEKRVALNEASKGGIEEAARQKRYAALGELCREHNVPLLLTAHHQDDQAETVLLQLLRGSGAAGLSGMDLMNAAPELLGDPDLIIARPLLQVSRAALEACAAQQAITNIEDESNADPRYARNALRLDVMPALARAFPGYAERFARTASHMQAAQSMMMELGAQDYAACADGGRLQMEPLRLLSSERIDNLLRYWFGLRGMRMPSTAWLDELRVQLLEAKEDAQLAVVHPDGVVRRHRDRVYLTPRESIDPDTVKPVQIRWQGEASIAVPAFGGILHFEEGGQGFDADWLKEQSLTIRYRSGGERLKLAPNRATRSLKQHGQALDIPAWERETLVVVARADAVLYVEQIGMDSRSWAEHSGIAVRWER